MEEPMQNKIITEEEMEKIMRVLKKEEEVLKQEQIYINELNEKLEKIKDISLKNDEHDEYPYHCSRCSQAFSKIYLYFIPFSYCITCKKRICRRTLNGVSGSWFDAGKTVNPNLNVKTFFPSLSLSSTPKPLKFKTSDTSLLNVFEPENIISLERRPSSASVISDKQNSSYNLNSILSSPLHQPQNSSAVAQEEIYGSKQESEILNKSLKKSNSHLHSHSNIFHLKKSSSNNDFDFFQIKKNTEFSFVPDNFNDLKMELSVNEKIPIGNVSEEIGKNHQLDSLAELSHSTDVNVFSSSPPAVVIESAHSSKINVKESTQPDSPATPHSSLNNIETHSKFSVSSDNIQLTSTSEGLNKSADNFNANGILHGMIRIEKIDENCILKIKVVEATDLRPIGTSTTVSSYVLCQFGSQNSKIFKKKTSTVHDCSAPIWGETFEFVYPTHDLKNLLIFLLVNKPTERKSFKSMLKKTDFDEKVYGSVRIGSANYLSEEEKNIWKQLNQNNENGVADWIDFKIDLKRVDTMQTGSSQQLASNTSATDITQEDTPQRILSPIIDDSMSYNSISSLYYGDSTISGLLKIFLKYSQSNTSLTVTLQRAENLSPPTKIGLNCKVFAKCKLIPKSGHNDSKKTILSKNPTDPEWNSSFIFKINPTLLEDTILISDVFRTEKIMSNIFLGQVALPIGPIIGANGQELIDGYSENYKLSYKVPSANYGFRGIISLSLRFNPISYDGQYGNLEIRILKVSNLKMGDKSTPLDSYVTCILLPNTEKNSRKTSPIVKKTSDPEYKFCFSYQNVSIIELKSNRCLEITIWASKSIFLGGNRVGSSFDSYSENWQDSSEIESNLWNQMLEKPKEWIYGSFPLRYTMISQLLYPILKENVRKLWSEYVSKTGAILSFDIMYSTTDQPSFTIEIHNIDGISIGNIPLFCKVLFHVKGIVSKNHTQYLEQQSENTWNKQVIFPFTCPAQTTGIEIRIKTISDDKTKKNACTVLGRILLSNGLNSNEWNLPSSDEIIFFNKLIEQPNIKHSAQFRLYNYFKPKNISRKSDKKLITLKKTESSIKINQSSHKKVKSNLQIDSLTSEISNTNPLQYHKSLVIDIIPISKSSVIKAVSMDNRVESSEKLHTVLEKKIPPTSIFNTLYLLCVQKLRKPWIKYLHFLQIRLIIQLVLEYMLIIDNSALKMTTDNIDPNISTELDQISQHVTASVSPCVDENKDNKPYFSEIHPHLVDIITILPKQLDQDKIQLSDISHPVEAASVDPNPSTIRISETSITDNKDIIPVYDVIDISETKQNEPESVLTPELLKNSVDSDPNIVLNLKSTTSIIESISPQNMVQTSVEIEIPKQLQTGAILESSDLCNALKEDLSAIISVDSGNINVSDKNKTILTEISQISSITLEPPESTGMVEDKNIPDAIQEPVSEDFSQFAEKLVVSIDGTSQTLSSSSDLRDESETAPGYPLKHHDSRSSARSSLLKQFEDDNISSTVSFYTVTTITGQILYFINSVDLKLRKIIITIYHKSFARNVFLGQVIIPMDETLNEILKRGYIENWYHLSEKSKLTEIKTEHNNNGEFHFAINIINITETPIKKYKKNSKINDCTLNIKILDAKNIATLTPVPSAICKVYLLNGKSKSNKKTTIVAHNKSGSFLWNEIISYEICRENFEDYGILVKILDQQKTSYIVGSINLNNGSKKFSWQDACGMETEAWNSLKTDKEEYKEFTVQLRTGSDK
ncbi:hypothetical protein HZS_5575 [Henneguya salminicola]|nr:hypothetical protein HZS_5575 [Henneguya salminicola]